MLQRIKTDFPSTASEIEDTQSHISKLKQELEQAQEIRNNKLEYDRIAHDILQLEGRDEYEK
jgi:THO complex subunit 7